MQAQCLCEGTLLKQRDKEFRRAQVISEFLSQEGVNRILDVGCAEGFMTSLIADEKRYVIGVDIHGASLAKLVRRGNEGTGHFL